VVVLVQIVVAEHVIVVGGDSLTTVVGVGVGVGLVHRNGLVDVRQRVVATGGVAGDGPGCFGPACHALLAAAQRWVISIKTKFQLTNTLPIILNCVIGIIN